MCSTELSSSDVTARLAEAIHVTAALLANRSASVRSITGRIAADTIINFFGIFSLY